MAVLRLKDKITGEWKDIITIQGDPPAHEIEGTKIRFQNPDSTWGDWIELEVLTAEQVPTSDGNNVQNVLDNITDKVILPDFTKKDDEQLPRLPNGYNLDNLKTSGIYYFEVGDNIQGLPKDFPTTVGGIVDVQTLNGHNGFQKITPNYTTNTWQRRFNQNDTLGTWTLVNGKVTLWTGTGLIGNGIVVDVSGYNHLEVEVKLESNDANCANVILCKQGNWWTGSSTVAYVESGASKSTMISTTTVAFNQTSTTNMILTHMATGHINITPSVTKNNAKIVTIYGIV